MLKNKHAKKSSSCITKKFNGFHIVSLEYGKMLKKKFRPVDISFKLIKKKEDKINCYFSKELHLPYRSTYNEGDKIKHLSAFQCYYCNNFYRVKSNFINMLKIVAELLALYITLPLKIL